MLKSQQRIDSLRKKMEELGVAKMPQKDVQKYIKEIDSAKQKVRSILEEMQKVGATRTKTSDYADALKIYDTASKKISNLRDKIDRFLETGGKRNSTAFKRMQYDLENLRKEMAAAKAGVKDIEASGDAYAGGRSSVEYKDLKVQLDAAKASLTTATQAYKNAQVDFEAATDNELARANSELLQEQSHLNNLASTYSNTQNQMESASRTEAIVSGFKRVRDAASNGFSTILKYAGKAGTAIKKVGFAVKNIGPAIKELSLKFTGMIIRSIPGFKNIGKGAESSAGKIGQLGSRIFSLAKTVFIWRVLRSALNSVRSAVSDSFGTYLNYDARLKSSIAGLKTSLATLQGSFASAFAPIISAAVPYISTLVNWLITAVNAVAAFIAALTGQSSYKRAVANVSGVGDAVGGAAGSLGDAADAAKELNKELGKYDDLSVIGDQDKSTGSGGSGGGGGGGGASGGGLTYEDVEIGSSISDMAEEVKEAWANADFTEIGNILGQKLEDGLLAIPWDGIRTAAQKIGKSVATLINGFVETSGLGDAIGMTVAEAINTGILGVESFAANLHWDSVGQFVADGINGALTRIKWENAINSASSIGSGIAAALNSVITPETFSNVGSTAAKALNTVISGAHSFIGTVDWSNWGKSIASSINTFFADFDWKKAGVTFSDAAKGLLNTMKSAISGVNWHSIGDDIATALKSVDWIGVLKSAADLVVSSFVGLIDFGGALLRSLNGSDWDNFTVAIDKTTKNLQLANRELEDRITNASEWVNAGGEYDYAKKLSDEYFTLSEKEGLTNDEKEKMKELAKKLVETVPDLEKYYNTETGLLDTTRTSVNNLIESLKAKARTEAAQDALKELYSAQMDAKKAMDESQTTVDSLTAAHDELNKKYDYYKEKQQQAIKNNELLADGSTEYDGALHGVTVALMENEKQLDAANKELKSAKGNYDAAGKKIDEVTGYLVQMNTTTENATTKTDKLSESIKNLPDDKKVKIQAILEDESLSLTEKKVKVAAEVTGLTDAVPLSDKHIDNIYANVIRANAGNGVSVTAPFVASSLSNNGKSVTSPFLASNLSNNGKSLVAPFSANSLSNNGKTVNAPVKATSITGDGKTLKSKVKVSSISNTKTMSTRVRITGQANTPTVNVRANYNSVAASHAARGWATGGVYSGGIWSHLPQFAAGGIVNLLSGKIAQFASGGAVDHGTVFVAGEKGSEIVGNIGGRTEILNKSQLASVMYSAVLSGMAQAVNGLAEAMRKCMVECTNAAIANLGYILENVRSINSNLGIPQVAVAGVPASVRLPDVNRVSQAYSYGSRGGNIDINSLADAVAKRVSINIGLENVMNLDGQPVYRKMVDIDYQTFKQTGKGGFEH